MSRIILYHGTIADFNIVNLRYAKDKKDFGKGFYLTSDINQACTWAKKAQRVKIQHGVYYKAYIYSFKLDSKDFEKLNTHRFVGANRSWLDYVIKNRTTLYNDNHDNYDIVIGKVADANAQFLFDAYLTNGNYSNSAKDTLIKALKTSNLIDQYCFKTPKSIQLLNNNNMQRKEV